MMADKGTFGGGNDGELKALLSVWEESASLSPAQSDIVRDCTLLLSSSSSVVDSHQQQQQQPSHDADSAKLRDNDDEEGIAEPIHNMQHFYRWFDALKRRNGDEEGETYREYLRRLSAYYDLCEKMVTEMDDSLASLHEVQQEYHSVASKTGSLHQACETLLQEQSELQKTADCMQEKLAYFDAIDSITRQLQGVRPLSVTDDAFLHMLERLDECVLFMEQHPRFTDSKSFGARFQQLQGKALSLIKAHLVSSLRSTTAAIISAKRGASPSNKLDNNRPNATISPSSSSLSSSSSSSVVDVSLSYVRFKALAPKLRPLCAALEARHTRPSYLSLLRDVHHCFVQQRQYLLTPHISEKLQSLLQSQDMEEMVRACCGEMVALCRNEHALFTLFFSISNNVVGGGAAPKIENGLSSPTSSSSLSTTTVNVPLRPDRDLLSYFSDLFYESLRSVFIRSRSIEQLCAAASVLRTEVMDSQRVDKGTAMKAISPLVNRMLEDIQERLVFLAQTFVTDEISYYKPSTDDLDYPGKLVREIERSKSKSHMKGDSGSSSSPDDEEYLRDIYRGWYPTLEKGLMCLSKLYLAVDSNIFEGLAQEIVSECSLSLLAASKAIVRQSGSDIDGQLFLIKHLLILREQITPFDIEFAIVVKQMDFTPIRNVFSRVVTGSIRSMFSLSRENLPTPKIIDLEVDSKKDLEKALLEAIDSFSSTVLTPALQPITSCVLTCNAFLRIQESAKSPKVLNEQTFASPTTIATEVQQVQQLLSQRIPPASSRITMYLESVEHRKKVLNYLKTKIAKSFASLRRLIIEHYTEQQWKEINLPADDALWKSLDGIFERHASLHDALSEVKSSSAAVLNVRNQIPPSTSAPSSTRSTSLPSAAPPPSSPPSPSSSSSSSSLPSPSRNTRTTPPKRSSPSETSTPSASTVASTQSPTNTEQPAPTVVKPSVSTSPTSVSSSTSTEVVNEPPSPDLSPPPSPPSPIRNHHSTPTPTQSPASSAVMDAIQQMMIGSGGAKTGVVREA